MATTTDRPNLNLTTFKVFRCAWCDQITNENETRLYYGEYICDKCNELRKKVEKEDMANWEKSLDRWLTTPPEEDTTECFCAECEEPLYVDDEYFELDGQILCEDCAKDWLDDRRSVVTEAMVHGGRPDED